MTEDTYRWTSSTDRLRPDGERIENGDEFSPTEHERRAFGDRMELVDDDVDGASRTDDEDGDAEGDGDGGND